MTPDTAKGGLSEALEILGWLCEDSLEVPLSHVDGMTESELREYGVSAKFKELRDLIVALSAHPEAAQEEESSG